MKRDAVLRTVWAQDAANVAFFEATLGKIVGHDADRLRELPVGERASCGSVNQRGFVAQLLSAMQREGRKRSFRDRDIWVGAFNNHCPFTGFRILQDLQDNSIIRPLKRENPNA